MACSNGFYQPSNFEKANFIHFSFGHQVLATARKWFPGNQDLLLLEVDQERVSSRLKLEGSPEVFPHLYQILDLALVKRIMRFKPKDYAKSKDSRGQKKPNSTLVLFDIDSTLLKGAEAHKQAFRLGFQQIFGISKGLDNIAVLHGRTDPDLVQEALVKEGIPLPVIQKQMNAIIDSIVRNFYKIYRDKKPEILAGVFDMLMFLKSQKIGLGLVTGNLEPIGWAKLNQINVDSFFSLGAFSSDSPNRSTLVRLAIEKFYDSISVARADRSVFLIGDAVQDMQAASKNEIVGIGVCTGIYSRGDLLDAGASLVVDDLVELMDKKEIFK